MAPTLQDHDKCFPRCATYEQYKIWRGSEPRIGDAERGFCTDCLPWYQNAMTDRGRCDHPQLHLRSDEDQKTTCSVPGCNKPRHPMNAKHLRRVCKDHYSSLNREYALKRKSGCQT